MKYLHGILLAFSLGLASSGSMAGNPDNKGDNMVTVTMETNKGTITLELDADKAPATVENFVSYAKSGHYDGTIFHRVIPGFMIQGGGFDGTLRQKPTRAPIPNEARGGVEGGLKNAVGTIAMARTANPDSATAQFFINVADNSFLNWGDPRGDGHGYAVFGKVTAGMDVVNKIAQTATGPGGSFPSDVPKTPVIIESASVIGAQ